MKYILLFFVLSFAPISLFAHKVIIHLTHMAEVKIATLDRAYCEEKQDTQGRAFEEFIDEYPITLEFYDEEGFFFKSTNRLDTYCLSQKGSRYHSGTMLTSEINTEEMYPEPQIVETTGQMLHELYPRHGYSELKTGLVGGNSRLTASDFAKYDINNKLYTANGSLYGFTLADTDEQIREKNPGYNLSEDANYSIVRYIEAGRKPLFFRLYLSSKVSQNIPISKPLKFKFKSQTPEQTLKLKIDYDDVKGFTLSYTVAE